MTAVCNVHCGSLETIPSNASPGLLFLKEFLPILGSLDVAPPIAEYCLPDCQFINGPNNSVSVAKISEMLKMRSQKLQAFKHDLLRAWDIGQEDGYTVIFEDVSTTQFAGDDVKLQVAEMNVWELKKESGRLKLLEARCFKDPSCIHKRAAEVFRS